MVQDAGPAQPVKGSELRKSRYTFRSALAGLLIAVLLIGLEVAGPLQGTRSSASAASPGYSGLTSWVLRHSGNPPGRDMAAMAYDPNQRLTMLYGGAPTAVSASQWADTNTWVWNGAAWSIGAPGDPELPNGQNPASVCTPRLILGPQGRGWPGLAYDGANKNFVLFGGSSDQCNHRAMQETWTWDGPGKPWVKREPVHSPPGRAAGLMAYDEARGSVILVGGLNYSNSFTDTWSWDGSDWKELHPQTAPPFLGTGGASFKSSMAYDPINRAAILVGGGQYHTPAQTWSWDGTNWTKLQPSVSPTTLAGGAMSFDPLTQKIIYFGGSTGNTGGGTADIIDETWAWDGQNWEQQHPILTPGPVAGAVMAPDALGRLILVSGICGSAANASCSSDTHSYLPVDNQPAADLSITQTASSYKVPPNSDVTLSMKVSNGGPDEAPVTVTDRLPQGFKYKSSSGSGACAGELGIVSCTLPPLPNGGSETVDLLVSLTQEGTFSNTATAGGLIVDRDQSNNAATVSILVASNLPAPNVDFNLSASPDSRTVNPGQQADYSVAINRSPVISADVTLSVEGLPEGASGALAPARTTASASALSINTVASTPPGDYRLLIKGVAGALTRTTQVSLIVAPSSGPKPSDTQTFKALGGTTAPAAPGPPSGSSGPAPPSAAQPGTGSSASSAPASAVQQSAVQAQTQTQAQVQAVQGSVQHSAQGSAVQAAVILKERELQTQVAKADVNPGRQSKGRQALQGEGPAHYLASALHLVPPNAVFSFLSTVAMAFVCLAWVSKPNLRTQPVRRPAYVRAGQRSAASKPKHRSRRR